MSQKLQVSGAVPTTSGTRTAVPSGATGVLLNVTATNTSANGFISVRPGDASGAPATSSLNVNAGQTVPNAVTVALDGAGRIDITFDALGVAGPSTDILIDVVGYTTASDLTALRAVVAAKADSADVYTQAQVDQQVASAVAQLPVVMYASVDWNGRLWRSISSPGVTATQEATQRYRVDFPVDVSHCAATASSSWDGVHRPVWADASNLTERTAVYVGVTDEHGALTSTFFDLIVVCPPPAAALLVDDAVGSTKGGG